MKRIAAWVLGLAVVAVVVAIAAGAFSGGTVRSSDARATTGKADGGKAQDAAAKEGEGRERSRRRRRHLRRGRRHDARQLPELPVGPRLLPRPREGTAEGDVVFGNLEGTLTDVSDSPKCGGAPSGDCYAFRTPPSYARDLAAAGFTVMNDANNHSYDFGQEGLEQTIAALHKAGIAQDGLPGEITVVKAGGEKVAFLGFAPYSTTASLLDLPAARALIRKATRRAQIVVVAIHAGAEGTDAQHLTGGEENTSARTAATRRRSPRWRCAPAPTWCSARARTSCARWRSTAAG